MAFQPQWRVATLIRNDTSQYDCHRRFFVGAFSDPLITIEDNGNLPSFEAASCTTEFDQLLVAVDATISTLKTNFHRRGSQKLHSDFTALHAYPRTPDPLEDQLRVGPAPSWQFDEGRLSEWGRRAPLDREGHFHTKLDQALQGEIESARFTDSSYPEQLIQYNLLAMSMTVGESYRAIAFVARLLVSMVSQKLIVAASVAINEDSWKQRIVLKDK